MYSGHNNYMTAPKSHSASAHGYTVQWEWCKHVSLLHSLNGSYTIRPKQITVLCSRNSAHFPLVGCRNSENPLPWRGPFSCSLILLARIGLCLICLSRIFERPLSSLATYQTQPITHFDFEDGNHMLLRKTVRTTTLTRYHNPNDHSLILYGIQIRTYCHLYWLL